MISEAINEPHLCPAIIGCPRRNGVDCQLRSVSIKETLEA